MRIRPISRFEINGYQLHVLDSLPTLIQHALKGVDFYTTKKVLKYTFNLRDDILLQSDRIRPSDETISRGRLISTFRSTAARAGRREPRRPWRIGSSSL